MKKAVITILMALPFVLIVIISVAGMILSEYTNISVEAVSFVDGDDNVISSVAIGKDDTYELNVQIYPRRATNRRVSFSSSNPDCVTVTDGVATGVDYGSSVITVTTSDGRKTATLTVTVTDSEVTGVSLDRTQVTLGEGSYVYLNATVSPITAVNRAVTWLSSDSSVATVNASGRVTAVAEGKATITVTTVDGGFTATCEVTVEGAAPLRWQSAPDGSDIYTVSERTIDLFSLLLYDENLINRAEIKFEVTSGLSHCELDGSSLTFTGNGIVRVVATAHDVVSGEEYQAEIVLRFGG